MGEETRQVVSGTVDAPPEAVFAVLADPARHREIDGSGMCQGCSSGPITGVGQSFVMDMYRDGLGNYQTRNEVADFEPGRRIAWRPRLETSTPEIDKLLGDIESGGQTWSFELEPTADGKTRVTHSYDWSTIHDERFGAFFPFITPEEMSKTVSALGTAAAKAR
jgi:uncharacterized protein YndB with AHSA1/START domain